jgi:hypothetical protein
MFTPNKKAKKGKVLNEPEVNKNNTFQAPEEDVLLKTNHLGSMMKSQTPKKKMKKKQKGRKTPTPT